MAVSLVHCNKLCSIILTSFLSDEHDDGVLHETLNCIKALCTCPSATAALDVISVPIFTKLLSTLFDPERKGPFDYGTRTIIMGLLFTYVSSATGEQRYCRALT